MGCQAGVRNRPTSSWLATGSANVALGPAGYKSGFELDMNGTPAVPEPATLLLVGTGALGALGWIRRRRVK
jgi:hypothetical protein